MKIEECLREMELKVIANDIGLINFESHNLLNKFFDNIIDFFTKYNVFNSYFYRLSKGKYGLFIEGTSNVNKGVQYFINISMGETEVKYYESTMTNLIKNYSVFDNGNRIMAIKCNEFEIEYVNDSRYDNTPDGFKDFDRLKFDKFVFSLKV